MEQKVWLITGVSGGLGRAIAKEAMAAGDIVVGTVRQSAQVCAFEREHAGKAVSVCLDVTLPGQVTRAVAQALTYNGHIDVLVNNAGYGLFGAIEEVSEAEARDQMETNFFGALAMTQAVLPHMRKRKCGHIVQMSSVAGLRATPGLGLYNASKFALEGMSEALALEMAPLGIRVLIVEPGPFRTNWAGKGSRDAARKIHDYAKTAHDTAKVIHGYSGSQPGDPAKAASAIVKAVYDPNAPLRLPLGRVAVQCIREKLAMQMQDLNNGEKVALAADFDSKAA